MATLAATRPSHLFLRAFKPPVCPPSNPPNPPNASAGLSTATLAATRSKPSRRPCQGNSRSHTPQPSVFKSVQACLATATLAATRPSHLFLRAFKPAVCPPSNPPNPPNLSAGLSTTTLAATRSKPSRRPFHGNSRSHTPQPSAFKSVQACRLPALKPSKPSKPFRKPFHGNSRSYTLQTLPQAFPRQLSQPHAPAICF